MEDLVSKKFNSKVTLEVITKAPADVKELLTSTVYGMKGEMQYRHKHASLKIDKLINPHFIALRRAGKLLGTAGFLFREISWNQKKISSYYVRYLSIANKLQSERKTRKNYKLGLIKTGLQEVITGSFFSENVHGVLYSYVEDKNKFSLDLCKLYDFEKIRKLSTFVFSRVSPKKNPSVSCLENQDKPFIQSRLAEKYKNYNFFFAESVFQEGNYYVYKENKKIVAGIKATKTEWEILNVPGFTGFLIQNLFPYLPLLSRLSNSKSMRFMAFEAAFCEEGAEEKLIQLMESSCAKENCHMGILWADSESELARSIKATGKLGLLNKLKKDVPANIVARFINVEGENRQVFFDLPAYISASDLS
jgi:hypothetical protein